ncbi:hypothetical protein RDI58_010785 [Solanum bulbocastanum]|uniref:Uncharacterized protein n=1 Tax=Solanum bulbocastanum TaxID=147425 RepID=A0AAN8TRK2_SOLBU
MHTSVSDHTPILMNCTPNALLHPKSFRLYHIVMGHQKFKEILILVWQKHYNDRAIQMVWSKLKALKKELNDLNTYMSNYKLNMPRLEKI